MTREKRKWVCVFFVELNLKKLKKISPPGVTVLHHYTLPSVGLVNETLADGGVFFRAKRRGDQVARVGADDRRLRPPSFLPLRQNSALS